MVRIDGLSSPFLQDSDLGDLEETFPFAPFQAFELETSSESAPVPAGADPTSDGQLVVVFAVDEDLRSATFHSAPEWQMLVGDETVDVAAPSTAVELSFWSGGLSSILCRRVGVVRSSIYR